MEYSSIVTLTKDGFRIPEKLLHPVGIYEGGRCWGNLITNVGAILADHEDKLSIKPQPNNETHILLSPIPFNSWGCMIRIQARLKDRHGTLKQLLEVLSPKKRSEEAHDLKLNIITITESSSGYYNGRAHILAELYDQRKNAKEIQKMRCQKSYEDEAQFKLSLKEKLEKTSTFSLDIFTSISDIIDSIKNSDEENHFLYSPKYSEQLQNGNDTISSYLWNDTDIQKKLETMNLDSDKKNSIYAIRDKSKVSSVSCEWLHSHALSYLYSLTDQPFRFDYSVSEGLLKPSNSYDNCIFSISSDLDINLPSTFLATFNPHSKYIRLVPLGSGSNKSKLLRVRYKYKCETKDEDKDISQSGSHGLLHHLTDGLDKATKTQRSSKDQFTFNIKNITSFSKRYSRRYESGVIDILGIAENFNRYYGLHEIKNLVVDKIGTFKAEKNENIDFEKDLQVSIYNPYKIFFSCREEIKKDKAFSEACNKIKEKYGILIEVSDANADIVTIDILNKFSYVDALIVIFSITDKEQYEYMHVADKRNFHPNLGWLLFEYGIGMGRNIPVEQLRDSTVVTSEQWGEWVRVSKDSSVNYIDRKNPEDMELKLEEAVLSIIRKLAGHSTLVRDLRGAIK
ncbi:MAG: hypothetical protein CTY34_11780 [Methylobacter sp.]|nr:MAG: hypothetical protein CTY34_11780 [Methylobacter sp.]PPD17161.1 MAG: hypothetical protein CTY24_15420 [Methylobacter sp.]